MCPEVTKKQRQLKYPQSVYFQCTCSRSGNESVKAAGSMATKHWPRSATWFWIFHFLTCGPHAAPDIMPQNISTMSARPSPLYPLVSSAPPNGIPHPPPLGRAFSGSDVG